MFFMKMEGIISSSIYIPYSQVIILFYYFGKIILRSRFNSKIYIFTIYRSNVCTRINRRIYYLSIILCCSPYKTISFYTKYLELHFLCKRTPANGQKQTNKE